MKKILNRENLSYAVIFLLPAYLWRMLIFGIPTNALEIMMLAFVVWMLLLHWQQIAIRLLNCGLGAKRYALFVGLILAGLAVSALVSGKYALGAGVIKSWFILPIVFALAVKFSLPQEKRKNIYAAFYFSAVAVAAVSLADYFFGQVTFDGRLEGIFNSPNYLAMYLAPALIIGIAFAKEIKQKKLFCLIKYVASYAIILSAFYLTYSYAAWVAVAISLSAVFLLKNKPKRNLSFFSLTLIAIFLLLLASQWNNQKFQALRTLDARSSWESRIMIWRSALKIAEDNPIFGIGPGNFQGKYLEYQKYFPPYLEWAVPHPHNLYLAFWLYAGIIGLGAFLLLLGYWFREVFAKEKNTLWLVSVGIMLYFLLHGLVDTTYFKNDLAVIFWLNFLILL